MDGSFNDSTQFLRGARWRPALAGSPVIFVFENSHFGHLKTCFSAPFEPGSRLASSIRVRHMAQRGGLIVSRARAAGVSEGGIASQVKNDARFGGRGVLSTSLKLLN